MAFRPQKTWKIAIEYPGDNRAVIEFKKPDRNADIKKSENDKNAVQDILDLIVGVEGLENEDGSPMTPEDVRKCNDDQVLAPIFWGFVQGKRSIVSEEENKKKFTGIV